MPPGTTCTDCVPVLTPVAEIVTSTEPVVFSRPCT